VHSSNKDSTSQKYQKIELVESREQLTSFKTNARPLKKGILGKIEIKIIKIKINRCSIARIKKREIKQYYLYMYEHKTHSKKINKYQSQSII
jgi:hypothetical protein